MQLNVTLMLTGSRDCWQLCCMLFELVLFQHNHAGMDQFDQQA
jgi:hypothetical protein